jgi:hypothetical protein
MQVIQNQFLKFLHKIYSSVIMYDKRVICESAKQSMYLFLGLMYYDWVDDFFSKICLYDFSQIGLDISVELGFTHYVCGKLFCNIRSKCLRLSNFDSPSRCLVLLSTRILYSVSVYFGSG